MPQDLTINELVKCFRDTNLGTYQGTQQDFGAELRAKLVGLGYANPPATNADIKAEHVRFYYSNLSAPYGNDSEETLVRAFNTLTLITIRIKMDPSAAAICLNGPIRMMQKATVAPIYNNITEFENLLNTFANYQIQEITNQVKTKLKPSQKKVLTYLDKRAAEDTLAGVLKQGIAHYVEAFSPMKEHEIQHAAAVKKNPGMDFVPEDCVRYNGKYKDLILNKLNKFTHKLIDKNDPTLDYAVKFNEIIRKVLAQYNDKIDAVQRTRLDAKLEFALSKLAIVLRKNGRAPYADEILSYMHPTEYKDPTSNGLFKSKKVEGPLDPLVLAKQADEFYKKLAASFVNAMHALLGRKQPVDPVVAPVAAFLADKAVLEPASYTEVAIVNTLQTFGNNLNANPDATEAKRKFLNRYTKVVAAYQEHEIMQRATAALAGAGVDIAADTEIAALQAIQPIALAGSFDLYKQGFSKLIERTDNVARPGLVNDKKYFDLAEAQAQMAEKQDEFNEVFTLDMTDKQENLQVMADDLQPAIASLDAKKAAHPGDLLNSSNLRKLIQANKTVNELLQKVNQMLLVVPANEAQRAKLLQDKKQIDAKYAQILKLEQESLKPQAQAPALPGMPAPAPAGCVIS